MNLTMLEAKIHRATVTAAHLAGPGDLVILASYCDMSPEEAPFHRPKLVFVDGRNRIAQVKAAETPRTLPAGV